VKIETLKERLNKELKKTINPLMDSVGVNEFNSFINFVLSNHSGSNVLDVGGGRGKTFDNKKVNYYVLDINSHNDKSFIEGDITDPDLEIGKKFDVIITKDTFEHILNPWDATENVTKHLNENGIFICIAPFSWRFHPSPYDAYRYSHQGLKYLFEHKGKLQEVGSGYIHYHSNVRGFWKNRCDWWPHASNNYQNCVCSFYVGQKKEDYVFDRSKIKGDFSIKHEEMPE